MSKQINGATEQANRFIKNYGNYSGSGSTLDATKDIRLFLEKIIKNYTIQSLNDAPCGDCSWIKHLNLKGVVYKGYELLDFVLKEAFNNMGNHGVLYKGDLVSSIVEQADLILCRDFIFHLDFIDGVKVLNNFKASKSKYLISTTFDIPKNQDLKPSELKAGYGWRKINLEIEPYNLGKPIERVLESNEVCEGRYVGLWLLTN
jgi:hypothetical protein